MAFITGLFTPSPLLVVGVAVPGLLYLLYLWLLPKPLPGIPYNKESAKSLLGDIPNIEAFRATGDTPRKLFCEMPKNLNSPVVQAFVGPFNKPWVIVSDFREAVDLQLRNPKALNRGWSNRQMWGGLLPGHFIGMESHDERFKDTKALAKDLMTPAFLNQVNAPASHVKVEEFITMWKEKMRLAQGRPFEALEDLGFLTYDVMCAAGMGSDNNENAVTGMLERLHSGREDLTPPSNKDALFVFPEGDKPALLEAMNAVAQSAGVAGSTPSPRIFHLINNRKASMKKALRDKRSIMLKYVLQASDRLAKEGASFQPRSAVDYIVFREVSMAEKAGRKPVLDSPRMTDGIFTYLIGGQDSTHTTLSNLVKHLDEEQDIQEKLRQSLFDAYPEARASGQQPKLDEILKTRVPYLDAFIEEVLRVSNPSFLIGKETTQDITILGHVIPKDHVILFSSWGPGFNYPGLTIDESKRSESSQKHRDDGLSDWGDDTKHPAGKFLPERWLHPSTEPGNEGELVFDARAGPMLTFSAGPRMCWGKRLAYLELRLIVTLLVWNFVFEPVPEGLRDWEIHNDMFIMPQRARVRLSSVPPPGKAQ